MSEQTTGSDQSSPNAGAHGSPGLTLAQAEQIDNPIVGRIVADMKARLAAKGGPDRRNASHSSHSSSPTGKGHTSYVTGKFEDS